MVVLGVGNNMTEQDLINKYPRLFRQKDLPLTHTAMCWGIDCGPGWYNLLDNMCKELQYLTDEKGHPQIEFTQIKEKFGTLRVYTSGESDEQFEVIRDYEYLSGYTCEECGEMGEIKGDYWIVTRCPNCL